MKAGIGRASAASFSLLASASRLALSSGLGAQSTDHDAPTDQRQLDAHGRSGEGNPKQKEANGHETQAGEIRELAGPSRHGGMVAYRLTGAP
jgi:hypothetical protein